MKKIVTILSLIGLTSLISCSNGNQETDGGSTSSQSWHNLKSPFTQSGSSIDENDAIDTALVNGLNNGRRYFVFPGNGEIWLYDSGKWMNVTPDDKLFESTEDFVNFNVDPSGKTVLALTTENKLLYFNGDTWVDTGLSSCSGISNLIDYVAINASFNTISLLATNGSICQYNSNNAKWQKISIKNFDKDSDISLSSLSNASQLYIFNPKTPSLTFYNDLSQVGNSISTNFSADDLLDSGSDGFITNLNASNVVLFSKSKNNFYFLNNKNSWQDTKLELTQYGATEITERGYYFDNEGNPYIFAALNNNKVIVYYHGKWQLTSINIPADALISDFVIGLSNSTVRLLLSYENEDVYDNKTYDIFYDYSTNDAINLEQDKELNEVFGSPSLEYLFAVGSDFKIYQLNMKSQQWQDTNFDLRSYGEANNISSMSATNDGVVNLSLSNGAVVSYY